jgi:hypothetical protein
MICTSASYGELMFLIFLYKDFLTTKVSSIYAVYMQCTLQSSPTPYPVAPSIS